MVHGVCRRMLANPADADDAFQATFLVLVRRARSIRLGGSLGPWLYGVSVRVARRARSVCARREIVEHAGDAALVLSTYDPHADHDLRLFVDEELARLPESFRAAIVLCHMQGLTHEQAAERLRCPVGTVRSRLARGRALLRQRLERVGSSTIAGFFAWPDFHEPSAIIARELIDRTVEIACRIAVGQSPAAVESARVANLVKGVTTAMTFSKFATVCSMLAIAGFAAFGVSRLGAQTHGGNPAASRSNGRTSALPASLVAFQAPGDTARKSRTPRVEATSRIDPALLADLPPIVVDVVPNVGAVDVDPGLREVRITFSKKMMDKSWSLTEGTKYAIPKVRGQIHYDRAQRTCVIPVELEPGKTYVWGVNSERFRNFMDADGRPALPYLVVFRTKAAR
jgi:RNA polymerase sigma-70 factor (ECF subfamily)